MSEYLSQIARLSPQQRFDMMDLGMNPLNPDHIERFNSGDTKVSMQENIEYIKSIIPAHELNKDLGHARHSANDPQPGMEYTPQVAQGNYGGGGEDARKTPQYIKKNLMDDMDEMVTSVARKNNQQSSRLLSLTQNNQQRQPAQQGGKLQEALKVGKERSTNFHNAYIKCLQRPSTAGYMEVYKALKLMLEQEQKLQNSQLLPNYKKGINTVTEQMYSRLTQQLND